MQHCFHLCDERNPYHPPKKYTTLVLPTMLLSVMACSELEVTVVAVSEIDWGRRLTGYGEGVTMTGEI